MDNGFHTPLAFGTSGNNCSGKLPKRAIIIIPSRKIVVAQYAVCGSSVLTLASLFSS